MIEIEVEEAERTADESDRASRIEAHNTEEAVRKVLHSAERPPADFDGKCCVECGEEIPEARLKTGAFRDIHCQQVVEARRKNHRSNYE